MRKWTEPRSWRHHRPWLVLVQATCRRVADWGRRLRQRGCRPAVVVTGFGRLLTGPWRQAHRQRAGFLGSSRWLQCCGLRHTDPHWFAETPCLCRALSRQHKSTFVARLFNRWCVPGQWSEGGKKLVRFGISPLILGNFISSSILSITP